MPTSESPLGPALVGLGLLLVIVGLVALWRAVRHGPDAKGDQRTMLLFMALVGALAALSAPSCRRRRRQAVGAEGAPVADP